MKKLLCHLFLILITAGFLCGCASSSNSSFLNTLVDAGAAMQQGMANDAGARLASHGSQTRYQQIIIEQQQRDLISQQEKQNETTHQNLKVGISDRMWETFAQKYNLTEEQKPKVKEVLSEQRQQHRKVHPALVNSGLSGNDLQVAAMAEHKHIDDDARAKLRDIMTPEQFALYTNAPGLPQRSSISSVPIANTEQKVQNTAAQHSEERKDSTPPNGTQGEVYQETKLPFEMKGVSTAKGGGLVSDGNGNITVVGGGITIDSLYLGKLNIPLASQTVTSDNMIVTKDYGKLQMKITGLGTWIILVTPAQEEMFQKLLAGQ